MLFSIPNITSLTDEAYVAAIDVDDFVIRPLNQAHTALEDIVAWFEEGTGVDNDAQKAYIVTQVDSLSYLLKGIKERLEGN